MTNGMAVGVFACGLAGTGAAILVLAIRKADHWLSTFAALAFAAMWLLTITGTAIYAQNRSSEAPRDLRPAGTVTPMCMAKSNVSLMFPCELVDGVWRQL